MPSRLANVASSSLPERMNELERLRRFHAGKEAPFRAIFTDIDNTFKRVSGDTEQATAQLFQRAQSLQIPLIAVTGLRFQELEARINSGHVPRFDAVVSSVGTSIHYLARNQAEPAYVPDQPYAQLLRSAGFDRAAIVDGLIEFIQQDEDVSRFRFRFQRPEHEAEIRAGRRVPDEPFKVSCFFEASTLDEAEYFSGLLAARVSFPRIRMLYCRDLNLSEGKPRYCLDLLACTKSRAVHYLTDNLRLKGGLICGDSGNDVAMLLEAPLQLLPVLVGGAQEEAKRIIAHSLRKGPNYQSLAKFEDSEGRVRDIYIGGIEKDLGPESILKALDLILEAPAARRAGNW